MITREADRMARLRGKTSASATLLNLCACGECDSAEAFAAGMMDGVRDWLAAKNGDARAYAVIQAVADGVVLPLVSEAPAIPASKPRYRATRLDWSIRVLLAIALVISGAFSC